MAAPDAIVELVEKFRANEQEYMQANFVQALTVGASYSPSMGTKSKE